jgi:MerC mercury resistance protein
MSQSAGTASSPRIDLLGVCVSLVCAVHCLTVPFLVTVLPLAGAGVLLGGSLEILFVLASVVLATVSLCWGFRRHGRWRVFVVLGAAVTMIALGRFLVSEAYELVFVVTGAMALAAGHLLNRFLCLTCVVCEDEPGHGGS